MGEARNRWGQRGGLVPSRSAGAFESQHHALRSSGETLDRGRLTRALSKSREALVMLAAPPGFGKTTLLREWSASEARPFASVSIEAADNDPVLLWTRVVEALRAVGPEFDSAAQIALHAPEPDVLGAVVPLLAHDLRFLGREVVLTLDDYQRIENRECHASLELFLHRMPPNVTLALSTRVDPPVIPVATFRARGELLELRAVDLCFTAEEEAALLNDTLGLGLEPASLAALHERTEGWPAGVYLASLSLRKTDDPAGFVASFSGSNRHVVDYLTEVVLDSLEPRRRQFLLETSILDSVCGPLAHAVTGLEDSVDLLAEAERASLFVVALDDERRWYRYHQLFGDLLRNELMRHEPARIPTLHRRAFEWYRTAGRTGDALQHARAAGDVDAAVQAATERWSPALDVGEARATLRWLEDLPAEEVSRDARLGLAHAWAASLTGRADESRHALHSARAAGLAGAFPDGSSLEATGALVEAFATRGDAGAMLAAARRAHELEPDLSLGRRPAALLALGWALYLAGDPGAGPALQEASASAAELDQPLHASIADSLLARLALAEADTDLAEAHARDALAVLVGETADVLACGMAQVALGASLARSSVEEAERLLDRGLAALRVRGEPLALAEALLDLAPVRRCLRGIQEGRACIAEARELLEGCGDPGMLAARLEEVARALTPAYRKASGDSDLTERELEVLRYLAEGLAKRDIATALFLSYNTIHSHTKSIYHKLRVSSREAAIAKARELGTL
jgi:LuxR family transcriptional regulator, maltose regulon positive regulatory protein